LHDSFEKKTFQTVAVKTSNIGGIVHLTISFLDTNWSYWWGMVRIKHSGFTKSNHLSLGIWGLSDKFMASLRKFYFKKLIQNYFGFAKLNNIKSDFALIVVRSIERWRSIYE